MRATAKKFGQVVVWLSCVALAVTALGLLIASLPVAGRRALILRSASMAPAMRTGDLVVVRAARGRYAPGDIVAFRGARGGRETVTTHRILRTEERDGQTTYITKGDANSAPDQSPVRSEDIIGKGVLVIPYIGKLLAFAKTRTGLVLLIIIPFSLITLRELRIIIRFVLSRRRSSAPSTVGAEPPQEPPHPSPVGTAQKILEPISKMSLRAKRSNPSAGIASSSLTGLLAKTRDDVLLRCALVVFATLTLVFPSTFALFSDSGTSSNNVFQADESFPADHLVISEVQVRGSIANEDFVELYNPTSSSVDLAGWKIRKKNSAGTESSLVVISSGTIPAHGFFLWANFTPSVSPDISNSSTLSENNSIALRMPDDTTVDQVAWGTTVNPQFVEGTAFTPSPDNNESIERKAKSASDVTSMTTGGDADKGNGFDSDQNSTDFILRPTSQPQNSSSTPETP